MSSMLQFENTANDFLSVLDNVIAEKLKRIDDTILCRIRQVNDNGTYNVTVEPDERNVVTGVGNILLDELKEGDYVWVYRIGQSFTNSFIIYKIGYNVDIKNLKTTVQANVYGGGGGGGAPSNITITTGDADGQIKIVEGSYSYNVNVKGLKGNAFTDTPIPTVYIQNASYANGILTITPHGGAAISIQIPDDTNFVTLATDQTISGIKTFTNTLHLTGENAISFDPTTGAGTYNTGVITNNNGIGLEAPLKEDDPTSEKLPITLGWRGGVESTGGLKIDSSGAYEKIDSGSWQKLTTCATYDFTDMFMSEWTINHNMNKYPQVTVIRTYIDASTQQIVATEEVIGDVEYIDKNNLRVKFENEIKGYAYLN